jgi:hypothetical protein
VPQPGGPGAGDAAARTDSAPADEGRSKVDELFARIKAEREPAGDETEDDDPAGSTPAPGEVAVVDEPAAPAAPSPAPAPAPAPSPGRADEVAGLADDELLRHRDATLDGIERMLARRLKRVLADEQNEVLDLLRQSMPAVLDDLLPERDEHVGRYAAAALADLDEAAGHGAAAIRGGGQAGRPDETRETAPADSCQALSVQLAEALVDPMRERVIRSLEESGGDLDEVTGRLRALYREWKGQHIAATVRHYAAAAYAAGAFGAAPVNAELRWLVDRPGECPDADDNALASGVRKGEPFPTGDRCAPAHRGCRCLVVPVPLSRPVPLPRTAGATTSPATDPTPTATPDPGG